MRRIRIFIWSAARKPGSTDAGVQLGAQATEADAKASLKAITERKGINTLTAVKEGRDYAIWHNYYNSPYNVIAAQVLPSGSIRSSLKIWIRRKPWMKCTVSSWLSNQPAHTGSAVNNFK